MLSQEKIASLACKWSNHWYSHRWWLPSWSCHTPSVWRMAIRRMLSTWSLGICQRGGLLQTSLPVPTTRGSSLTRSSQFWLSQGSDIQRVAPLTMSYNILCLTSNTYDISKISFRFHTFRFHTVRFHTFRFLTFRFHTTHGVSFHSLYINQSEFLKTRSRALRTKNYIFICDP